MVGTNCRLQNSQPAGYLELDLSVLREIRCPLRNNLLQGQRSLQAPLLVTSSFEVLHENAETLVRK